MLELPFMLGPARVGGRSREIVEGPGKEYLRRISGCFHRASRELNRGDRVFVSRRVDEVRVACESSCSVSVGV